MEIVPWKKLTQTVSCRAYFDTCRMKESLRAMAMIPKCLSGEVSVSLLRHRPEGHKCTNRIEALWRAKGEAIQTCSMSIPSVLPAAYSPLQTKNIATRIFSNDIVATLTLKGFRAYTLLMGDTRAVCAGMGPDPMGKPLGDASLRLDDRQDYDLPV